jgi:hypothetical protein
MKPWIMMAGAAAWCTPQRASARARSKLLWNGWKMMRHRYWARATIAAVAAALLVPALAAPATASAVSNPPDSIRIGPTIEESVLIGSEGTAFSEALSKMKPCRPKDSADTEVAVVFTYPWGGSDGNLIWPGGDTALRCGVEGQSGLRQIESMARHASTTHPNSWEALRHSLKKAHGGSEVGSWVNVMWEAAAESLVWARNQQPLDATGTVCFSMPLSVWVQDDQGNWVTFSSWYVNTIASPPTPTTSGSILTSYLSDNSSTPECNRDGL